MSARYTVVEPLGRGTRVFRGVAVSNDGDKRDVAIMRVLPSLTRNERFVGMFLDDLRASLRLKNPGIVEVLDIAKAPKDAYDAYDAYFVVTEYVEGVDLKTLLARRERIAVQHALHVLIECSKALAYAHSLEVMHRDLSPRALLLSITGDVKIANFGLAKAKYPIESSEPGLLKEAFGYLSPEVASGLSVDHRADIFAAGILLWELLAGRRLFVGETEYQTLVLVRDARFVPIDGLDPALDAVLRKALARDADARYQSATAFADALAQYVFARGIKLSPGDTAAVVHDVQREIRRERAVQPIDPRTVARVQAEVGRMISIVDDAPIPRVWNEHHAALVTAMPHAAPAMVQSPGSTISGKPPTSRRSIRDSTLPPSAWPR